MEERSANVFQELDDLQSKINFLFQDLMNEKNQHKLNLDESRKDVEKLNSEVRNLKEHNETLKQSNEELKDIIVECFKLIRNINSSGQILNKNGGCVLEMLENSFSKINKKIEDLPSGELNVKIKIEYDRMENENRIEGTTSRSKLDEEAIKNEIELISKLNFSTQFFQDDEVNKKNQLISNKIKSEPISEKAFEGKPRELQVSLTNSHHLNKPAPGEVSAAVQSITQRKIFVTPEKSAGPRSPVFKDLGNKKQDNLSAEENGSDASKPSSSKLVNERYLLRNADLIVSPLKRPSSQIESPSPKRGESTPKRLRRTLHVESPKRPSSSQLKKSFFSGTEISSSGVRKFAQALLNIEYYKKKSPDKKKDVSNVENEAVGVKQESVLAEIETILEGDDDDVIWESPKIPQQMLDGLAKNKNAKESVLNSAQFLTPPAASGAADLDETYVSSSVVKNCKLAGNRVVGNAIENHAPTRDKSPEYDSVPFAYKREPVRKKAERMKLPGHTCLECLKYYKEEFGSDANSQNLKEVLNKCSRHRDRNPPSVDDTPPGYWKPYLTATNIMSPDKNDPVKR